MAKKFRKRPAQERVNPLPVGQTVKPGQSLRDWALTAPNRYMTRGEFLMWLQGFEQSVIRPHQINPKLVEATAIAVNEILAENCQNMVGGRAFGEFHMDQIGKQNLHLFPPGTLVNSGPDDEEANVKTPPESEGEKPEAPKPDLLVPVPS